MLAAKLITFDVTGTILSFRTPIVEKYCQVGLKFGIQTDPVVLERNFRQALVKIQSEHPNFGKASFGWQKWWSTILEQTFNCYMKPEEKETKISQIADYLLDFYGSNEAFCIRSGTEQLLSYLKQKNVTTGIISNNDPRLCETLKLMDLDKYFDFVLISYNFGFAKPDKRIFEHALKLGGCVSRKEAIHVGDDVTNDYFGSKCCGMRAILISSLPSSNFPTKSQSLKGVDECDIYHDFFTLKTYFESLYE